MEAGAILELEVAETMVPLFPSSVVTDIVLKVVWDELKLVDSAMLDLTCCSPKLYRNLQAYRLGGSVNHYEAKSTDGCGSLDLPCCRRALEAETIALGTPLLSGYLAMSQG